jgi:hypothetical protein
MKFPSKIVPCQKTIFFQTTHDLNVLKSFGCENKFLKLIINSEITIFKTIFNAVTS